MEINKAKITYYNGPKNYGKCQEGFDNHMNAENVEKLEKITDEYVAKVNELLEEGKKATVTLDFIIKSTDSDLKWV